MSELDRKVFQRLALCVREAISRQPAPIQDQLNAALDAGNLSVRAEEFGGVAYLIPVVDGRELAAVPLSTVDTKGELLL